MWTPLSGDTRIGNFLRDASSFAALRASRAVLPQSSFPPPPCSSPLVMIGAQMLQGSGVAGPTAALRARVCFLYCASSPSCDPARRHAGA